MKTLKLFFALSLIGGILVNCSSTEKAIDFKKDYKFEKITFDIKDNDLRLLLESQKNKTKFKKGQPLKTATFIKERKRIVTLIRKNQNPDFSENKILFEVDTTLTKNKFSVIAVVQN